MADADWAHRVPAKILIFYPKLFYTCSFCNLESLYVYSRCLKQTALQLQHLANLKSPHPICPSPLQLRAVQGGGCRPDAIIGSGLCTLLLFNVLKQEEKMSRRIKTFIAHDTRT